MVLGGSVGSVTLRAPDSAVGNVSVDTMGFVAQNSSYLVNVTSPMSGNWLCVVQSAAASVSVTVAASIVHNLYCDGPTNHCYELLQFPVQNTFATALTLATYRFVNGTRGYLATITSSREMELLQSSVLGPLPSNAFLGAQPQSGSYYSWVCGPETGVRFATSTSCLLYCNWLSGMGQMYGSYAALVQPNGMWISSYVSASYAVIEYGTNMLPLCAPGYVTSGVAACIPCNIGTYSSYGASACSTCTAGTTTLHIGSSTCSACAAGSACSGGAAPVPCSPG